MLCKKYGIYYRGNNKWCYNMCWIKLILFHRKTSRTMIYESKEKGETIIQLNMSNFAIERILNNNGKPTIITLGKVMTSVESTGFGKVQVLVSLGQNCTISKLHLKMPFDILKRLPLEGAIAPENVTWRLNNQR